MIEIMLKIIMINAILIKKIRIIVFKFKKEAIMIKETDAIIVVTIDTIV